MSEQVESPTTIRDRAVAVADYLLAVRAQMERPARTVPADAHRLDQLPEHPACQLGPAADGTSWLRVGLPDLPRPVAVPAALRRRLRGDISAADEPIPGRDEGPAPEAVAAPGAVAAPEAVAGAGEDGEAGQAPPEEEPTEPADDFDTWRDQV